MMYRSKNYRMLASLIYESIKNEYYKAMLYKPEIIENDKTPKDMKISTREPIDLSSLAEKALDPVDREKIEEEQKKKDVRDPIIGLLQKEDLALYTSDDIFMIDFNDWIKSIVKKISSELSEVDKDMRFDDIISTFKASAKVISSCIDRYPSIEDQWVDWQYVIKKRYRLKDNEFMDPKRRKYQDKKPDEKDVDNVLENDGELPPIEGTNGAGK